MKKIIAIITAAAMVMPMTAYGAAVTEDPAGEDTAREDVSEEEGMDANGIGEAVDNFVSALGELREEWESAVQEYEDAEADDEESKEESKKYEAYDAIVDGILEDIRDTVGQLKGEWESVREEIADVYDMYEADEADEAAEDACAEIIRDYLSGWKEDCMTEIGDLMDRTNAASRDFLRMAVPDTDGDDEALEEALNYYYESVTDGIIGIICDEIFPDLLNTAIDSIIGFFDEWDPDEWDPGEWSLDEWNLGDWDFGDWDFGDWGFGDWNLGEWDLGGWDPDEWDTDTILDVWSGILNWWEQFDESEDEDQGTNMRLRSLFNL